MSKWKCILLLLMLLPCLGIAAQQATVYEYWLDNDTENRVSGTLTQDSVNFTASIDVSQLKYGVHYFNFRAKNELSQWGNHHSYIFFIERQTYSRQGEQATEYEYWLDNDVENKVSGTLTSDSVNFSGLIDVSQLKYGVHYFNFRAKNELGQWGNHRSYIFFYERETMRHSLGISGYRYAFDGERTEVETDVQDSIRLENLLIPVPALRQCRHWETATVNFSETGIAAEWRDTTQFVMQLGNTNKEWSLPVDTTFMVEVVESDTYHDLTLSQYVTIGGDELKAFHALRVIIDEADKYQFTADGHVQLRLYTTDGQLLDTLTAEELMAGTKRLLDAGTYYGIADGVDSTATIILSTEIGDCFTVDGITYRPSTDDSTAKVMQVEDRLSVLVPRQVEYGGITWTVTAASDTAFVHCPLLCAVVWEPTFAMPSMGLTNPNLLVYVSNATLAPQGVQNVVVNGICDHLVLVDAPPLSSGGAGVGSFFAPISFTARRAEYTHRYTLETPIGGAQGWETICLPFNVQTVMHETKGELAPFADIVIVSEDERRPFWLYGQEDNGAFVHKTKIEAYKPYLIAMPNNSMYLEQYQVAGNVTFSTANARISPAPAPSSWGGEGISMVPTLQFVQKADSVYALNIGGEEGYLPGSMFIRNSRDVQPFQCYITLDNAHGAPRLLPILELMDGTNGIDAIQEEFVNGTREALGSSKTLVNRKLYDILGRKVDADKRRGITISRGKKRIRR